MLGHAQRAGAGLDGRQLVGGEAARVHAGGHDLVPLLANHTAQKDVSSQPENASTILLIGLGSLACVPASRPACDGCARDPPSRRVMHMRI